jgi:hypothetical protein
MFIFSWPVIKAVLCAFGFYWCYAVIRRLPAANTL